MSLENTERVYLGRITLPLMALDTPPNPPSTSTAAGCLRNRYQFDVGGDKVVWYGKRLEVRVNFGGTPGDGSNTPYDSVEVAPFYSSSNPCEHDYSEVAQPTDKWGSAGTQVAVRDASDSGGNILPLTPNGAALVALRIKSSTGAASGTGLIVTADVWMILERASGNL